MAVCVSVPDILTTLHAVVRLAPFVMEVLENRALMKLSPAVPPVAVRELVTEN